MRWRRIAAGRYLTRAPMPPRRSRRRAVGMQSGATMHETTPAAGAAPADTLPADTARCGNCHAPLQGQYCHACGQSRHSPTRHLGHAIEEVFESFWHLDGRVWRTLRDLLVPGRVARDYLAGHRVRYIAPLRLFVILTLLTFFVGRTTLHIEADGLEVARHVEIGRAASVAEVERLRDARLAEIRAGRRRMADGAPVPGVEPALVAAEIAVRGEADARIAELRRESAGGAKDRNDTAGKAAAANRRDANDEAAIPADPANPANPAAAPAAKPMSGPGPEPGLAGIVQPNGRDWDPRTNPVTVSWLPAIANRWLNRRMAQAEKNIAGMKENPDLLLQAFLGALPTALFVLVPLFALLLKLVHLGSGRLYLEHLVVALYSHAFLLLSLLALFVLAGIGGATSAPWVAVAVGIARTALLAWMPVYLFVMQKRVYGGHWLPVLLRYLVLGAVYVVLVSLAAAYAALAGISA
jgi:hypothetical protein